MLSWKNTEINVTKADFDVSKKERLPLIFVSMSQVNLKLCEYSPYLCDMFNLILWNQLTRELRRQEQEFIFNAEKT